MPTQHSALDQKARPADGLARQAHLLKQRQGLAHAFATRIYDSERVFHPQYDDFADTAFCCGAVPSKPG